MHRLRIWEAVQYFAHRFGVRPAKVGRSWVVPTMGEGLHGRVLIKSAAKFMREDRRIQGETL